MRKTKFKSQKEIIKTSQNLKRQGKKVVTYNGSFDLLHFSHINTLKEAKSQGDVLIVLVNSDKSVKSYKGPNRPIIPQKERAEALAALEWVDYISIFDEINPKAILAKIKPNLHCCGRDWGKDCIEREVVEKNGGRIHVLKWTKDFSTTKLIKKVLDIYSKPEVKAVFLDRDGTININEPEHLYKIKDFKFSPYAISALSKLSKTDYKIIILTNQSGIGRGYFKEKDLKKLHSWLFEKLNRNGIRIDKFYYCPHRPENNCFCRKPKIGLLKSAVKDFAISLNKSWIIGDSPRDIIMGREANVKTIKLGNKMPKELKIQPHHYVKNLKEAVEIILENDRE